MGGYSKHWMICGQTTLQCMLVLNSHGAESTEGSSYYWSCDNYLVMLLVLTFCLCTSHHPTWSWDWSEWGFFGFFRLLKFLQVSGLLAEIEGEGGACCCEGSVEYESVYRGVYPLYTRNSWRLTLVQGWCIVAMELMCHMHWLLYVWKKLLHATVEIKLFWFKILVSGEMRSSIVHHCRCCNTIQCCCHFNCSLLQFLHGYIDQLFDAAVSLTKSS